MRIIHLSDIHVWRLAFNPLRLLGKRSVGFFELLRGRARRFRLERLADVVARVQGLNADHILITGDLTTTALPGRIRRREGRARALAGRRARASRSCPGTTTATPGARSVA